MLFYAHPIAGSEKSGINACGVDLFMDKKLILINDVFTSRKSLQFSKMIWQLIGSKVIPMRLNDHEKVFCYLSHLPHLVSFAMVNTVGKKNKECIWSCRSRFLRFHKNCCKFNRDVVRYFYIK